MAISRVKTWSSGEVLTASDLNAEFNNILSNAADLVSPFTKAISMGGFALNFDAANTIALTGATNGVSLTGGAFNTPQGADIVASATLNLDTATGNVVDVTGNTGITAVTLSQGRSRWVRFTGTPTITNGASLVLPGGTYTAAAGDYALFIGYASSVVRVAMIVSASGLVLRSTFTTKGDLVVATAAGTVARLGVGSNGTIAMARSADTNGIAYVAAISKAIYGLTYSNNAGDATNDIDIAAGGAMDATGAYWLTLASTLTKQSDVAWAVGSGNGGLDTGAVGNSDYYIWLIARSDTGVVDALYSLSSTAPTMPTSYDFKRLIGWIKRTGGTIVAFHTYETEGGGLEFNWDVPTVDIQLNNTLTTARRTDALRVPLNFSTIAHINAISEDVTTAQQTLVCCPDMTDAAPSQTSAPQANIVSSTAFFQQPQLKIRTSAAGLVASRSTLATVDVYNVTTVGFTWARRN